MNMDPYPHAGKPLNKPILREILPNVYPGTGWFTVAEFQDMAENYHRQNGGAAWAVRNKRAAVFGVLTHFEEDGRTERQRNNTGEFRKIRGAHLWQFRPLDRHLEGIREEIAFLKQLIETLTERQWHLENALAAEEWTPQ